MYAEGMHVPILANYYSIFRKFSSVSFQFSFQFSSVSIKVHLVVQFSLEHVYDIFLEKGMVPWVLRVLA